MVRPCASFRFVYPLEYGEYFPLASNFESDVLDPAGVTSLAEAMVPATSSTRTLFGFGGGGKVRGPLGGHLLQHLFRRFPPAPELLHEASASGNGMKRLPQAAGVTGVIGFDVIRHGGAHGRDRTNRTPIPYSLDVISRL